MSGLLDFIVIQDARRNFFNVTFHVLHSEENVFRNGRTTKKKREKYTNLTKTCWVKDILFVFMNLCHLYFIPYTKLLPQILKYG